MLQIGEVIGNYTVESLVGEGGFATVYRMRHTILTSVHALKVLHRDLVQDRGLRQRFLNEARMMACLRHPNIVRATDTVSQPGIAGIVMDFIEGGSLGAQMDAMRQPASHDAILDVFLPILDALHFAHQSGIVHRDIKPGNILLDPLPDGGLRPMLTDFGVARLRGEITRAGQGHTMVGMRMGTPGYMSPEQIRSATDVDARSDVFSIAVTMYEYATLQRLFERPSEFETMQAIVSGDQHFSAALCQQNPGLVDVLRHAMAPDPQQRLASCEEFAAALRACHTSPSSMPHMATPPQAASDVELAQRPTQLKGGGRNTAAPLADVMDTRVLQPEGAQPRARLIYEPETADEQVFLIHQSVLTIGQAADNDIRLPHDGWVSHHHCRLEITQQRWVIRDNMTANGTVVNGHPYLSRVLVGGEEITIGQTRFRFETVSDEQSHSSVA